MTFQTSCCNLYIRGLRALFLFSKELWWFKVKECSLLNKNISFNRNETESKIEIPDKFLEKRTLCFSSFKNRELKGKMWRVGARERKTNAFFVKRKFCQNFFKRNVSALSQFIVYWINFQDVYTFTYQKTLLHILLLFLNSQKPSVYP